MLSGNAVILVPSAPSRSGTMFKNLRTASDEMILAEALIYFVFIGTLTLGATLATALIR
jgi:hypothetical protein